MQKLRKLNFFDRTPIPTDDIFFGDTIKNNEENFENIDDILGC